MNPHVVEECADVLCVLEYFSSTFSEMLTVFSEVQDMLSLSSSYVFDGLFSNMLEDAIETSEPLYLDPKLLTARLIAPLRLCFAVRRGLTYRPMYVPDFVSYKLRKPSQLLSEQDIADFASIYMQAKAASNGADTEQDGREFMPKVTMGNPRIIQDAVVAAVAGRLTCVQYCDVLKYANGIARQLVALLAEALKHVKAFYSKFTTTLY